MDDYGNVEYFINNYCVINTNDNIMAIDLINAINSTMGTKFGTRGSFPNIMSKYMLLNPKITKKKKSSGICYNGINLIDNGIKICDIVKSIIKTSFEYTDDQYEYVKKNKLIKLIYSNGALQEKETITSTVDAINEEFNATLMNIRRNIKSINIIVNEFEKARNQDLIQSILQINPKYEVMYNDDGELFNPYSINSLPLIYDRRLNMEQSCKDCLKLIKDHNVMINKLNILFIKRGIYEMKNIKIPELEASSISIIEEGSMVKCEYDRKTKELIDNMEKPKRNNKSFLKLNIIKGL